jgi:D-alanyl-D-alanine carboxypeptidase/D-alanyl-D-alanine-endopeptidase (penicillin-binding protein 4)
MSGTVLSLLLSLASAGLPTRTLDSLIDAASRPRGGTASAAVVRLRDGAVLWEHDAWRRMLPASTQKTLTGAAQRALLGSRTVFSTRLLRTGTLTDSVLSGDLVLEGGGDPAFGRDADSSALEALARELRAKGVRRVTGASVLRDPLLGPDDPLWPGSWDWDNSLTDCDGAPSTGLSLDGNCPHDSSQAFPHRRIAQDWRTALRRVGIRVEGPDRFELGRASVPTDSVLAVHPSAPFDSLLRHALWRSSNHDMETFGLSVGKGDAESSRAAGLRKVRAELASLGLDTLRNDLVDQCGLSRKNAISALAMATTLARIARDPAMDIFPLLPAPGEGTLRTRFQRTLPAGARLRAKTGSIDGTSALIGRLVPKGGDTLVFVLLFQGHTGPAAPIRFAQDQIVGVLAGGPVVKPLPADTLGPAPRAPKPRLREPFLEP